jgi:hypothetical protein
MSWSKSAAGSGMLGHDASVGTAWANVEVTFFD